jgi:hypothetical protein
VFFAKCSCHCYTLCQMRCLCLLHWWLVGRRYRSSGTDGMAT